MRRHLVLAIALLLILPLLYSTSNTGRPGQSVAYDSVVLAQGDPPPMCALPPCEPKNGLNVLSNVSSSNDGGANGIEYAAGVVLVMLLLRRRMKA